MLCGWGVKAGMACLQVKLCVAISEHFDNALVFKDALRLVQVYFYLLTLSPFVKTKKFVSFSGQRRVAETVKFLNMRGFNLLCFSTTLYRLSITQQYSIKKVIRRRGRPRMDRQHQVVDKGLSMEESVRMTQDRDK